MLQEVLIELAGRSARPQNPVAWLYRAVRSFLDLAVILEEIGYNLCPGPFFSTAVLGVLPLLAAASDDQKSQILP